MGIEEKKYATLEKRGIHSDIDLCYLTPYKFYDFTTLSKLEQQNVGSFVAIKGFVRKIKKSSSNQRTVISARIETSEGMFSAIYLGQKFMMRFLEEHLNCEIIVCGKLDYSNVYKNYSILNPLRTSEKTEVLKWLRIYPKYRGIGEEWLKNVIMDKMKSTELVETIPSDILSKTKLPGRVEALWKLHNPKEISDITQAMKRQIFEDLLYFACVLERNNRSVSAGTSYNLKSMASYQKVTSSLPYELTADQKKVLTEIFDKMKDGRRASELIQGDVGCGKSIVGFLLMLAMADSGYQSVLMAPTLVLAEQHYLELSEYANICGFKVAFLHGGLKAKEKRLLLEGIENNEYQLVVGTHAVLSEKVVFHDLAMVIIDEEHRFGVAQRNALVEKAKNGVHTILFSATPIPRTMANTIYGNSNVHEIKTKPAGRQPVQTAVVRTEKATIGFVKKEIEKGNQIYVVCPLIENEDLDEKKTLSNVSDISKMYEKELGVPVGIVTGKQNKKDTQDTLNKFKNGEISVLVATTVIEVGVNNPNATVIVIEDAWMFGLAQLHQLRGRVGRGKKNGYCILRSEKDVERLNVMTQTTDGFEIAEMDAQLRGSGNVIGEEQSGNNRFLQTAMNYPNLFKKAIEYAKNMVDYGTEDTIVKEMEKRSEKIYMKEAKIKIF